MKPFHPRPPFCKQQMDNDEEDSILIENKATELIHNDFSENFNENFPKSVAFIIGNEFCER